MTIKQRVKKIPTHLKNIYQNNKYFLSTFNGQNIDQEKFEYYRSNSLYTRFQS